MSLSWRADHHATTSALVVLQAVLPVVSSVVLK